MNWPWYFQTPLRLIQPASSATLLAEHIFHKKQDDVSHGVDLVAIKLLHNLVLIPWGWILRKDDSVLWISFFCVYLCQQPSVFHVCFQSRSALPACLRRSLNSQTADDGFCTFPVNLLSIEFWAEEETLGVILESASSVKKDSCLWEYMGRGLPSVNNY